MVSFDCKAFKTSPGTPDEVNGCHGFSLGGDTMPRVEGLAEGAQCDLILARIEDFSTYIYTYDIYIYMLYNYIYTLYMFIHILDILRPFFDTKICCLLSLKENRK